MPRRTCTLWRSRSAPAGWTALLAGGAVAVVAFAGPAQALSPSLSTSSPSLSSSSLSSSSSFLSSLPAAAGDQATGEVLRVVDGPTVHTGLRTATGEYVPVAGADVDKVTSGATVRVTVNPSSTERTLDATRRRAATTTNTTTTNTTTTNTTTTNTTPTTNPTTAAPLALDSVQVLAAASTAYTPGNHELTVAIVTPAGAGGTPPTESQIRQQVSQVSSYWSEQSRGGVTFSAASVSQPFRASASCADPFGLWTEAAARTGFRQGANKHLVVVVPRGAANCSYGLGSLGAGVNTGGVVLVADTAWPVLAHELGHNLGLQHANHLSCAKVSDASLSALGASSCAIKEYGDPWDVMAASPPNNSGSLSTPQAHRIGLLPGDEVVELTSGSRTVDLRPVASLTGTRMVKVTDPKTGQKYYVEYRTRAGRDYLLYAPMTDGVRVLRESAGTGAPATLALDASPTGSATDYARGVPVGGTFTTYGGGVHVRVESAGGSSARVTVSVGAAPTTSTPATSSPTTTTVKPPVQGPTPVREALTDATSRTGRVSKLGSGGWYETASAHYLFRTALVTYSPGATWTVTVDGGASGKRFELLGTAFTQGAAGTILVDGRTRATFDSYRASNAAPYRQSLRVINIPAGQHTVTVVARSSGARNTLALDAYRLF